MYELMTEEAIPAYIGQMHKETNSMPQKKYTKNSRDTREDPTTPLDQTKATDLVLCTS